MNKNRPEGLDVRETKIPQTHDATGWAELVGRGCGRVAGFA